MTQPTTDQARDEKQDMKVLVEYIKTDLFTKVKFVYVNAQWDVGGQIYNDYIKCCEGKMGSSMTAPQRKQYMHTLWLGALTKKLQNKALIQKRSAIYTVMQNKFSGK
jgi:hypothetical protein